MNQQVYLHPEADSHLWQEHNIRMPRCQSSMKCDEARVAAHPGNDSNDARLLHHRY